jgi:hypothetical protein
LAERLAFSSLQFLYKKAVGMAPFHVSLTNRLWLLATMAAILPTTCFLVAADPAPTTKSPLLVIDYGDGVEKHFTKLEWRPGMTVLDLLKEADEHPRGIEFEQRGRGETAFVSSIDGLEGEGGGRKKRNWLYFVNDQPADRSCGILEIQENDQVAWRFAVLRPR